MYFVISPCLYCRRKIACSIPYTTEYKILCLTMTLVDVKIKLQRRRPNNFGLHRFLKSQLSDGSLTSIYKSGYFKIS